MLATDLADHLVRRGVPFRETHHVAGEAVKLAEASGRPLSALSDEEVRALHPGFGADPIARVWSFENSVESRDAEGGTSRRAVLEQVARLRAWVQADEAAAQAEAEAQAAARAV